MTTISERSDQTLATLYLIEDALPLGECNGRYQRSFADAIALQGKPILEYTLAELITLAEQHKERWLESEQFWQSEHQHLTDTGGLEYTQ
ncbi:MAG: hypothetical protein CL537_02980 [Alcanivoracaceae bacterium]|nr:hypothetical protein [Alcanivoracaceae bacterium]|tara:strand:- start:6516 stop:6785 length:270 start_codon:yes stop_codon:yes gene_type:complete